MDQVIEAAPLEVSTGHGEHQPQPPRSPRREEALLQSERELLREACSEEAADDDRIAVPNQPDGFLRAHRLIPYALP